MSPAAIKRPAGATRNAPRTESTPAAAATPGARAARPLTQQTESTPAEPTAAPLLLDLRGLILAAREQVAREVNSTITTLYWRIGTRIRRDILGARRADYGAEIVATLSSGLSAEFGRGFDEKSLRHMLRFAEAFPDESIVSALRRELSWTHLKRLIYLRDPLARDFYAEMCRLERWSVRTLETKIQSMLYERTALSKKPSDLIAQELAALRDDDRLTPDLVFRDPYLLDFLGLRDTYSERDLESALLREIERFLLELGAGFAFLERQKRITLDGDDYHMDLLFYHRHLRRLVVIELKIGDFTPADAGQVELYLRWLDKYERRPGEEPPLALILCAGAKRERIELLDLGRTGIHVAEYLTALPPKEILCQKLHAAIARARASNTGAEPAAKALPISRKSPARPAARIKKPSAQKGPRA